MQRHLDRVLALAGIFQATALVQAIARDGSATTDAFSVSIESVFRIDAESAEDVFGGADRLQLGLDTLCRQLGKQERDVELTRYAVTLLFLERKLVRRSDLMTSVREGLTAATSQAEYFSSTHDNVVARLADIYSNTVSTLSPRVMVSGEPRNLECADNANRIRALLLAGIRAAVLWRQLGGNRLQLLFSRNRIVRSARTLLSGV